MMPDSSHIATDTELDVPIRSVTATNEHPRPWNSPEVIRQALELPVQRACWLLREMGIATTASTANAKNIGDEAGIAIDLSTLTEANRASLAAFAASHPASIRISERSASLLVPIDDGEVTARAISDQFIKLIEGSGLKQQPAKWAAPMSPEQLLRERVQDLYEMRFWRTEGKPEPVNVLDELMKALSFDPEHGLTMDEAVYEKYRNSADYLEKHGIIEVEDGKPVLKGVHDPDMMAILLGRVFDPNDGRIWLAEETKEYYERTVQLTREARREAARTSREQAPLEIKSTDITPELRSTGSDGYTGTLKDVLTALGNKPPFSEGGPANKTYFYEGIRFQRA